MLQLKRKSEKEKERETVIVLNWVNIHSKLHICNYIQHVNREMARWIKHTKCVKVEFACHSEESPFPPVAYSRPFFSFDILYICVLGTRLPRWPGWTETVQLLEKMRLWNAQQQNYTKVFKMYLAYPGQETGMPIKRNRKRKMYFI